MRENGITNEHIEKEVKSHGKSQGLTVISAKVVTNRYRSDMVGCLIRIPESQVDKAIHTNTWPDQIEARLWGVREKNASKYYRNDFKKGGDIQRNRGKSVRRSNNERYDGRQNKKVYSDTKWYNEPQYERNNDNYGGYYEYHNSNYDSWVNDEEWRESDYQEQSYRKPSRMNDEDIDWFDMAMEDERRTNRGHY